MTTIGPLTVRQTIHDQHYGTRLVPLPADVLPRIARALAQIPGGLDEFLILAINTNPDGHRRGVAINHIITAARDTHTDWDAVLGIDLTPERAVEVATALQVTAEEPTECEQARCTNFAGDCLEHQAAFADPWMSGVA